MTSHWMINIRFLIHYILIAVSFNCCYRVDIDHDSFVEFETQRATESDSVYEENDDTNTDEDTDSDSDGLADTGVDTDVDTETGDCKGKVRRRNPSIVEGTTSLSYQEIAKVVRVQPSGVRIWV